MKVFIQRSKDRLFWKAENVWVGSKEEAKDFRNCAPAIDYCVEHKMADVRLWVAFDDPKYDFPMEVFRAEMRVLLRYNKELREKGRQLLSQMDQICAEAKERKKQFEFKRKPLSE